MPKRKRDDVDGQNSEGRNSVRQRRVEQTLKLGATKLGHAFKVAKGLERRKLGRRRKTAVSESNEKDVARIDAEIEALKVYEFFSKRRYQLWLTTVFRRLIHRHQLRNTYSKLCLE